MRLLIPGLLVFASGFVIMVLEIIGARYLAKDFGGSFYVWISQIGVVLIALAVGYVAGGTLADRRPQAPVLLWPLLLAGTVTFLIPQFTPALMEAIVMRHPVEREIPLIWQKLDPALGSAAVFFVPCCILAAVPPFMTRVLTPRVERVGQVSGLVYAASTVGGIAGVFVSGYVLLDCLSVPDIFRVMGLLTVGLGLLAGGMKWREFPDVTTPGLDRKEHA